MIGVEQPEELAPVHPQLRHRHRQVILPRQQPAGLAKMVESTETGIQGQGAAVTAPGLGLDPGVREHQRAPGAEVRAQEDTQEGMGPQDRGEGLLLLMSARLGRLSILTHVTAFLNELMDWMHAQVTDVIWVLTLVYCTMTVHFR